MIHKWRKADLSGTSSRRRKDGAGRKPLNLEMEEEIKTWIDHKRERNFVVRRKDIQDFAKSLEANSSFKASSRWLDGFFKRNNLSLRRSTTLSKLTDDQIINRAVQYVKFVKNIDWSIYDERDVLIMDETAVYFGEASQTTVAQRGSSSISVASTGYESHRVTCILGIKKNGRKITPLLITKGKGEKIEQKFGIDLFGTEKAWATQLVIRKWVEKHCGLITRGDKRGMIIWDAASTHRAQDMKAHLQRRRIDQIMIPSGTTGYLQSLDLVINKPFKDNMREEINNYLEFRSERNSKGNLKKPRLEEVCAWVKRSWDRIRPETIEKALKQSLLHRDFGVEEMAISRHERLGTCFLNKLDEEYEEFLSYSEESEFSDQ